MTFAYIGVGELSNWLSRTLRISHVCCYYIVCLGHFLNEIKGIKLFVSS